MMLAADMLALHTFRLQFGAIHGLPGTGKTFLMLILYTLPLCVSPETTIYLAFRQSASVSI